MSQLKILVVDDEPELRKSVLSTLRSMDHDGNFLFEEAQDGEEAITAFERQKSDLVLMDVRMPKLSGLEALKKIKEKNPQTFVVIMTAHSNLPDAVQAIKDGAYDYIEKPLQSEKLIQIFQKCMETRELISKLAFSNPIFDDDVDSSLVGSSEKMKEIFYLINRLSKVEANVLIRGENGTGKELVARAIHFNSPRKKGDFVAINCGAIPENLMESELFGHEKGAFTGATDRKIGKFQVANNGTVFLDEIAELKVEMQVKLLRVLQDKKFSPVGSNRVLKTNTRILAATNQNLEKMVEEGTFREDLFFRLNVIPIFLPPLRERVDDIPSLSFQFLRNFSQKYGRQITEIDDEVLRIFKSYSWPGNIRELENTIERAFVIESANKIQLSSLPKNMIEDSAAEKRAENTSAPMDFDVFKEKLERDFIENALKSNQGRINKTVANANIPKNTLLRKIKKYGINVKDFQ